MKHSISANKELWIEQYRQEMFDRDQRSSMSAAKREGRMEGSQEKAILLAKKYMTLGHSAEEAAAFAEIDVGALK